MSDEKPRFRAYNYLQVTPTLATSGVIPRDEFDDIASAGYRVVINLLPDDNQYALAREATIVTELGMSYVHIPIDIDAPTIENFREFRRAMKNSAEKPVWVHCAANWRVSAFVSLYGQIDLGWTAVQGAELTTEIWEPSAPWVELAETVLSQDDDVS